MRRRGKTADRTETPSVLATAQDATETGLLIGALGSPIAGVVAKLFRRQPASPTNGARPAGTAAGKRAGTPPS